MKELSLSEFLSFLQENYKAYFQGFYPMQGQIIRKIADPKTLLHSKPWRIEAYSDAVGFLSIIFPAKEKIETDKLFKIFIFPPSFVIETDYEKSFVWIAKSNKNFDKFKAYAGKLYPRSSIGPYIAFSLPVQKITEIVVNFLPSVVLRLPLRIRFRWNEYFQDFEHTAELLSFFKLNKKLTHFPLRTSLYTDIFYSDEKDFLALLDERKKRVLIYAQGKCIRGDNLLEEISLLDFVRGDVNFQKIFEGIFFPKLKAPQKEEIAKNFEASYPIKSGALDKKHLQLVNLWMEYEKTFLPTSETQRFAPEVLEEKYAPILKFLSESEKHYSRALTLLTCLYAELLSIRDIDVIIDFWGDTKRTSVFLKVGDYEFWLDYEYFVDFRRFLSVLKEATNIYDFSYHMKRCIGFAIKPEFLALLHSQFLFLLDIPRFCEIYLGKSFSLKEAKLFGWKNFFYNFVNKIVADIKTLAIAKPNVIFEKIEDCLTKAKKLYSVQQLFDLYFFYSEESDGYWAYIPYCSLEVWLKLNYYRYWNVKNIANFLYTIKLYQHSLKNETEDLPLMFYEYANEEFWCFRLPERLEKSLFDFYKNVLSILKSFATHEYIYIDDLNIRKAFKALVEMGLVTCENRMYVWKASQATLNHLVDLLTTQVRYKIFIEDPFVKKHLTEFLRNLGKEIVEIEDMVVINSNEKEDIYVLVKSGAGGIEFEMIDKSELDSIPF